MNEKNLLLGKEATHNVSGFHGKITAFCQYLNSEDQYAIQAVSHKNLPNNHLDLKWFS